MDEQLNGTINPDWEISRENGGVLGADEYVPRDPDMMAIRKDYRWTPACQRAFLEELAATCSVTRAAKHVAKSPKSAYDLRYRRDGAAFGLGWDAAILIARATLSDVLMDRAVCGYEEMSVKHDDGTTMRGKFDNRLGLGLLNRLDRMAEAQAVRGSQAAMVRLITQDFHSFLELIESGGQGSEAALFCAARDDAPMPGLPHAIQCELAQISAAEKKATEAEPELALHEMEPEEAAATLSVWYDDGEEGFRTNFPLEDPDDADLVEETGLFGDDSYERTLTPQEEEAQLAINTAAVAPLRNAALLARAAWFAPVQEAV